MPKSKQKNSYVLFSLTIPILLVLAFLAVSGYLLYKENTVGGNIGYVLAKKTENKGNSSKDNSNNGKSDNKEEKGNSNKPDKIDSQPGINSYIHKNEVKKVKTKLAEVADVEQSSGNDDVSGEIEEVINELEESSEYAEEAIEEVESRPAWKTFLFGSDYKNLGELRSQLVRNRNTIKKLNKSIEKVQGEENQQMLQEQLQVMEQEQERLEAVIKDNEEGFSLLGWAFRLINGYSNDEPIGGIEDPVDDDTPQSTESTDSSN